MGVVLVGLACISAVLFVIDVRLPLAFLGAVTALVVALERPFWGVCLLIVGRLTSTGANAWVRLGPFNIDLFEPALLLGLGALVVHAVVHGRDLWLETPWRPPVLAFLGFQVLSLTWSVDPIEGLQEVVATCILLCTTLIIAVFVDSWERLRTVLIVWLCTSLFVVTASALGLAGSEEAAFEMSQGNRASGFGQHPNWFAMNLCFIICPAFALGLMERKRPLVRWAFLGAGLLVFLGQMSSGSRAGTGSVLLGGGLGALFHPRIRRFALWLTVPVVVVVLLVVFGDTGAFSSAFERVFSTSSVAVLGASVRESNWLVCWLMFQDTYGLGIGGGGYEATLMRYDWWLYNSQYTYPHGIFWGMLAHYGAVGVLLWAWFVLRVLRMGWQALRATRGREEQLLVWGMIASLVGYFAWSWVEFMYDDKPFWEFLALFTVLWTLVNRPEQGEAP